MRAIPERDPGRGHELGAPCALSYSGSGDGDQAAAAKQHQPGPRWEGSPFFCLVVGRLSVTPARRCGRTPLSGVSQTEAAAGMPPSPAAPAKSALSLPFQAKKDQPDPRVAGLGEWIETSARRLALPCGGKRFSAVPAWVSQAEPFRVTFRNCQGARSWRFSSLSHPGGCFWGL